MYNNLTDEEVLEKYKSGDDSALDFLLEKYKSLASKISRSYFLVGAESEDILQEAMIGLYSACRTFDKSNNSSFKTFATLCINRSIQTAIKKANRQKNKILNESFSLTNQGTVIMDDPNAQDEEIYLYVPSNVVLPEDLIIAKERAEELKQAFNSCLSTKEKKVLTLYLKGMSYADIAKNLGENTKSVDNAISRTKKKLETIIH